MNHLLEDYWEDLRWEALITWHRLNLGELNQVDGESTALEYLLQTKYGHSVWECKRQIAALIERYDNLAFLASCEIIKKRLPKFWPNLTHYEVDQINCSRIRLLQIVEKRNECSKGEAMDEVSKFLRQFMD